MSLHRRAATQCNNVCNLNAVGGSLTSSSSSPEKSSLLRSPEWMRPTRPAEEGAGLLLLMLLLPMLRTERRLQSVPSTCRSDMRECDHYRNSAPAGDQIKWYVGSDLNDPAKVCVHVIKSCASVCQVSSPMALPLVAATKIRSFPRLGAVAAASAPCVPEAGGSPETVVHPLDVLF
jgi:hypothetical protein